MIENWIHYKIDDICDISSSKRIYRDDYVESGVPFYRGKEIILKAKNEKLKETLFISEEKYQKIRESYDIPIPGDILLTSVGTLGVPYFIKDDERFYFKDGNLTWFRNYKEIVNRKYFYFWLLSPKMKNQINAARIGVAQPALTIVSLKNFEINLPSLSTQKNIASILSAYDTLIENNTRRIQILEEMAQRIYKEWFVDFKYPGHENDKFVDSELGMIPKGWSVVQLGNTCTRIQAGGTPLRSNKQFWMDGSIRWYKTKELQDNFLFYSEEKITEQGLKETSAKLFDAGTILMAIYGSPTVGRLGVLTEPSSCNQAAIGIVPDTNKISQSYLFYSLFNLREYFNSIAMGAAQQNISKEKVVKAKIVLPSFDIINQFDDVTSTIMSLLRNFYSKNLNIRETRDLLLPKLISGKIDISDLDIDTSILNE